MLTLGILGLDYCGSTVVSNVLSGLPGVVNVGESHWILDRELGCRECGSGACPVFSKKLLSRLRKEDIGDGAWWDIISQETGFDIIISSDKLPRHYERFGIPDKILFLYKDPRANIYSWCKRKFPEAVEESRNFSESEIKAGIGWWLTVTNRIVNWIEAQSSSIAAISLEDFTKNPSNMVRGISRWLGTEFDPSAIEFWNRELHYIGGNHSVKRLDNTRHFYNKITMDNRWKDHIDSSASEDITSNPGIKDLLARALSCSNA